MPKYKFTRIDNFAGAGSGIGRAVCRIFASEGATVIAADMNDKGMAETMSMIQDTGSIIQVSIIGIKCKNYLLLFCRIVIWDGRLCKDSSLFLLFNKHA